MSYLNNLFEAVKNTFKRSWQFLTHTWNSLCTWWKNLSHFWKDFHRNVAWGLLIAILLALFHHRLPSLMQELDDLVIDQMIGWYRGISPPRDSYPFVIFNINETTYRDPNWGGGEPLLTPRDKLLQLLQLAAKGHPKLIIVDIELSRPTTQDAELLNYLETYCQGQPPSTDSCPCPPIIFARALQTEFTQAGDELPYRFQKSTLFDDAVAKSPYLYWGTTLFEPSPSGTLRRWNLWEATCKGNSSDPQPDTVIPSIQLLAAKLLMGPPGKEASSGFAELDNTLKGHFLPKNCANPQHEEPHHTSWWQWLTECLPQSEKTANTAGVTVANEFLIDLSPSHLNRRVIYTIPSQLEAGEARPKIGPTRLQVKWLLDNQNRLDITLFKDSIIVIGGSYADSGDIHATPLGWMPGYLIIINALQSLTQFGNLKPMPPCLQYLGIELIFILLVSWIFAHPLFNSLKATLLLGTVIAITLVPLSVLLLEYGIWLNFLLPLIGVMLHQRIAYVEELRELAKLREEHQTK